jgi:hypothetical protein
LRTTLFLIKSLLHKALVGFNLVKIMLNATYDLRYLQAGIDQLESYLLSRDLYRPIGIQPARNEPPYPPLTPGWLLLAYLRAQATAQTPGELEVLERANLQLDSIRARWRSAWGNKSLAEFHARLNLWRDFLEEYRQSPGSNYDRYGYEVNRRVLLELLTPEANLLGDAELQARVGLDLWLQAVFNPGPFIWDATLISSFPQVAYWYLYGTLPKQI